MDWSPASAQAAIHIQKGSIRNTMTTPKLKLVDVLTPKPVVPANTAQSVLEAIAAVDKPETNSDLYTTSNGVVLKIKAVSPFLMRDAQSRITEPEPPVVPNPDKEGTLEENPNDPGYIRAVDAYRQTLGEVANAIMLSRGTELISVPDGMEKPEDTNWAEDAADFAQVTIPSAGRRRYYCWLKYQAVTTMSDFTGLIGAISAAGQITIESEVATEADSFRNIPEGDSATGVRAEEADGRGDSDYPPPPRASA